MNLKELVDVVASETELPAGQVRKVSLALLEKFERRIEFYLFPILMTRLINRLLIFGLTFTLVVLGVWLIALNVSVVETHFVAKRTDEGGTRLRTEEFESIYNTPNDSLDFLFLGSSTCYCGIDPYSLEVNGYKSFSLCSSAQRLGNSSDILDYALSRCTPQTVRGYEKSAARGSGDPRR